MRVRVLLSFHYHRDTDVGALSRQLPPGSEIFADSGAYSAFSAGAVVKLADYKAWLSEHRRFITTAATLDVIGDPEATQRNTMKLNADGLKVIPVFHTGSPFARLEQLCEEYPYIALGGMVPFGNQVSTLGRWLIRCFKIGERYGTRFHGFGQTSPTLLSSLPFYSVDSSTWSAGVRFGEARLWNPSTRRFRVVLCGRPVRSVSDRKLLTAHGISTHLIGAVGFAQAKRRGPEQFKLERAMLKRAGMVAHMKMGEAMAARHQVAPPEGWRSKGTVLYLAVFPDDITAAISAGAL